MALSAPAPPAIARPADRSAAAAPPAGGRAGHEDEGDEHRADWAGTGAVSATLPRPPAPARRGSSSVTGWPAPLWPAAGHRPGLTTATPARREWADCRAPAPRRHRPPTDSRRWRPAAPYRGRAAGRAAPASAGTASGRSRGSSARSPGRRGVSPPAGHRSPTAQRRSLSGPSSGQARCHTGRPAASEAAATARSNPLRRTAAAPPSPGRDGAPPAAAADGKPAAASGPKARGRRRWSGRSAARRRRTTAWRRAWRPAPGSAAGRRTAPASGPGSAQRPPVPRRRGATADRSPPSSPRPAGSVGTVAAQPFLLQRVNPCRVRLGKHRR